MSFDLADKQAKMNGFVNDSISIDFLLTEKISEM